MYVHNFGRDARAAQDALAPSLPADPAGNGPAEFSTVGLIGYLPASDEGRAAIRWESDKQPASLKGLQDRVGAAFEGDYTETADVLANSSSELLSDLDQRVADKRAYVPLEFVHALHNRRCHVKIDDADSTRTRFTLTYGPGHTSQPAALKQMCTDLGWVRPAQAPRRTRNSGSALTVVIGSGDSAADDPQTADCVHFMVTPQAAEVVFPDALLGGVPRQGQFTTVAVGEWFLQALGLQQLEDSDEEMEKSCMDALVLHNALVNIHHHRAVDASGRCKGFRWYGPVQSIQRILPLLLHTTTPRVAEPAGDEPNKVKHIMDGYAHRKLSDLYENANPGMSLQGEEALAHELEFFKSVDLWPRRCTFHLSQMSTKVLPRADAEYWGDWGWCKLSRENSNTRIKSDALESRNEIWQHLTAPGQWTPLDTARDSLSISMHTGDPSDLHSVWTGTGTSVHQRLYFYALAHGMQQAGQLPGQDFFETQQEREALQLELDPADGPVDGPAVPIACVEFENCADLHSESSPPYSVKVPKHTLRRLCPPIEVGVGYQEQAKDSMEYSWAVVGAGDDTPGLHKVFCDNAWDAVMELVDEHRERFLTYTADEIDQGELEERKAAYEQAVCTFEVNVLAPECTVFWPYGGHNRPRARTPQNMSADSVRGYETRIDCVLEAVYTPDNSDYRPKRVIIIVEYKTRMEQASRDGSDQVDDPDGDDPRAAYRFARTIALGRTSDRLQIETNSLLFALCNPDIVPTHAVIVQTTRRQVVRNGLRLGDGQVGAARHRRARRMCGLQRDDTKAIVAYACVRGLDFYSEHFCTILSNMLLHMYGSGERAQSVYADEHYYIRDLHELLERFSKKLTRDNKVPTGPTALMTLWEMLPKMQLMWDYDKLCREIMHTVGVPYEDTFYHTLMERHQRVLREENLQGSTYGWRVNPQEATNLDTALFLHRSNLGEVRRCYTMNQEVTLADAKMAIITGFQNENTAISSVQRYVDNRYKINGDLATGHAYITSRLPNQVLLVTRHPNRKVRQVDKLFLPESIGLVSRSVSRIFRAGVVVPFRPDNRGPRMYPQTEPAACKAIRLAINTRIHEFAAAFLGEPGYSRRLSDRIWTPEHTFLKGIMLGKIHYIDFFAHSVASVVSRSSRDWLAVQQDGDWPRSEFEGWEELLRDVRAASDANGSDWTVSDQWLAHNSQRFPYEEHFAPMHKYYGDPDAASTSAEARAASLRHKHTSFVRAVHRLVNQRLLKGIAALMGEPVDCLLSEVEQILEDTLHVDNVQYMVGGQQSEFPVDRFTHLSQRALWQIGALNSVWTDALVGRESVNMVDVAALHVAEDLKFVTYSIARQIGRQLPGRNIASMNPQYDTMDAQGWLARP